MKPRSRSRSPGGGRSSQSDGSSGCKGKGIGKGKYYRSQMDELCCLLDNAKTFVKMLTGEVAILGEKLEFVEERIQRVINIMDGSIITTM